MGLLLNTPDTDDIITRLNYAFGPAGIENLIATRGADHFRDRKALRRAAYKLGISPNSPNGRKDAPRRWWKFLKDIDPPEKKKIRLELLDCLTITGAVGMPNGGRPAKFNWAEWDKPDAVRTWHKSIIDSDGVTREYSMILLLTQVRLTAIDTGIPEPGDNDQDEQ